MNDALLKLPEAEIKKWAEHIAMICLSDDFRQLRDELEGLYRAANIEQANLVAFSDALFTFLAEKAAKGGQ
ncbi:MAG: hypothetical protein ACOYU7_02485 [Bacillota bacterium]